MLPPQVIKVRSFRITGIGESDLDTLIAPVYTKYTNPVTTVLSAPGDLFVHLARATGQTEKEADCLLREVGNPIAELLGDHIYTENAEESLDQVIGRSAAEEPGDRCDGRELHRRPARLPPDRTRRQLRFLHGRLCDLHRCAETACLGVSRDLLQKHTAVSEPVAAAMAEGARARSGATYALSATGYAGPAGGTDFDPVGTVYLGIAGPEGTNVTRIRYGMDRYRVRTLADTGLARSTAAPFAEEGQTLER